MILAIPSSRTSFSRQLLLTHATMTTLPLIWFDWSVVSIDSDITANGATKKAAEYLCLDTSPCTAISLTRVHLYGSGSGTQTCNNAHGTWTDSSPTPCLSP
jgi:hypothetical protein